MRRVVVAGAGIAGLSTAWMLKARDPRLEVVVLESANRTGGNIRTQRIEGYLCESGPDGFLDNAPATLALVRALDLDRRLQPSHDTARRRFIFRKGLLHEVPVSPLGIVRSRLLTPRGKLRLALEPFAARRQDDDESIHRFAERRIGSEAATVLVGSMVSGIFAGDSRALSLRACFPRMRQLEDQHGSLFRALLATRRTRAKNDPAGAPPGRLTSFVGGMSDLIDALCARLGSAVRTSSPVVGIHRRNGPGRGRASYHVITPDETLEADAVVLAGPSSATSRIVRQLDPELSVRLAQIDTAPLAVVSLGYDARAVNVCEGLRGFGFLAPRDQSVRILGTLWETSIYPDRAPEGKVLLRVMIGGACDRGAVALDDEQLLEAVRHDLASTMGVIAAPEFVHIVRHSVGIPQYVTGHASLLGQIDERIGRLSGLHMAGNSYRSPSVNACIAEGKRIADDVMTQMPAG
jgi:protoporphyrinogen/coproporphyrinogen III oxidase